MLGLMAHISYPFVYSELKSGSFKLRILKLEFRTSSHRQKVTWVQPKVALVVSRRAAKPIAKGNWVAKLRKVHWVSGREPENVPRQRPILMLRPGSCFGRGTWKESQKDPRVWSLL